ncbi:MAG TPA: hypothetical protein VGJ07_08230 [Rugosimonospora sp.]|jgi:hypothetical protein
MPDDIMRVINCYRAHGLPNYPDPTYDPGDGRWHYPNERPALTGQVRQACASVMPQATPASPIPSGQLADLLKFASCVRAHGAPDWPDPGVDGVFRSDSVLDVKGDPGTRSAVAACDQYLASSGGNISVGQPNG